MSFNWRDSYISYLNLDQRMDRNIRMLSELERVGIKAVRTRGKLPYEFNLNDRKVQVMRRRTPGAIPCYFGQVAIMKEALRQGKNAIVFEDDLCICDDIIQRLDYIEKFVNEKEPLTDVVWLGGTYHLEPTWHASNHGRHTHPDLKMCHCTLNKDWEPTEDKYIVRTYGCWSTYAYIVNYNSIEKILKLLDENLHLSMGIDWLFILLQPQLKTFAFNPGCVKQYNNESNIGNGITNFEGFERLGKHWWADRVFNEEIK